MQAKSNGKTARHRIDVVRPNIGTQCGEVAVFVAETCRYAVVKVFANRQAAERELAQVLEGFGEMTEDGTLRLLSLVRIKYWVAQSRKGSISPDGSASFEIKQVALFV